MADNKFPYRLGFGKLAENLIEPHLKKRYEIYHFGYEVILERICQSKKKLKYDDVYHMIQSSPDFVICSDKGELTFVEVRATRKYTLKQESIKYPKSERWHRILHEIRYYPKLIIINVVWNSDKPEINVYSGKLIDDGKNFELNEDKERFNELFSKETVDDIFKQISKTPPPPSK